MEDKKISEEKAQAFIKAFELIRDGIPHEKSMYLLLKDEMFEILLDDKEVA